MKVGDIVQFKIANLTETRVRLENVRSGRSVCVDKRTVEPPPLRPGKARRLGLGVIATYTVIAVHDNMAWVQRPFEQPEVLPAANFENI